MPGGSHRSKEVGAIILFLDPSNPVAMSYHDSCVSTPPTSRSTQTGKASLLQAARRASPLHQPSKRKRRPITHSTTINSSINRTQRQPRASIGRITWPVYKSRSSCRDREGDSSLPLLDLSHTYPILYCTAYLRDLLQTTKPRHGSHVSPGGVHITTQGVGNSLKRAKEMFGLRVC
jgi:hypothetical protein